MRMPRQLSTVLAALGILVVAMVLRAAFEPALGSQATAGDRFDAPFALVDQTGRPFTADDLAGKPRLLYFGYTSCPDVCPTTLAEIANWIGALGADAARARFVFVTVDPERDTVPVLKEYLAAFSPRLIGLTGDPAAVDRMLDAYHVFRARVPEANGGYSMNHTATMFLVDADGTLEDTIPFRTTDEAALKKLRRLVAGG